MATLLTERFCGSVKAVPGRQVEYCDSQVPGLALRVSGAGRKVWTFKYRNVALRQGRVTIGIYSEILSLAEARIRARRLQARVDEGGDPAADFRIAKVRERGRAIVTFDDLAAAYFEACEKGLWAPKGKVKRKRSLDDERNVYRLHVKAPLGRIPIKEMSRAVIRRHLREMFASGIGAQTNKAHQMIRGCYSFAICEEIEPEVILYNPAMGFGRVAPIKPRTRVLSDDEWRIFWAALDQGQQNGEISADSPTRVLISRHMCIALKLCSFLLQRKSEIIGMRRSELDFSQGIWLIPPERMKGGKQHLVPLSRRVMDLISEAIWLNGPGEIDCVFPNPRDRSTPMRGDSVSHAMRLLNEALGIKNATPHDLRRTGASAMTSERLEIPPLIRSRVLGHSFDTGGGASVTSLYYDVNTYARAKRMALAAWQELLVQIVEERMSPRRPDDRIEPMRYLLEWMPAEPA